jgi:mono/diheme cytochrome c family protein
MPHYYGLSNNDEKALKGTGQELFPDAEVAGIAYYLFSESAKHLEGKDTFRKIDEDRVATLTKEIARLQSKKLPFEQEQKELNSITRRLELFGHPQKLIDKFAPLAAALDEHQLAMLHEKQRAKPNLDGADKQLLADLEARQKERASADAGKREKLTLAAIDQYPTSPEHLANGRKLFSERGCLACHTHRSVLTDDPQNKLPALPSDASFGPNLSQIVKKLVAETYKDEKARKRDMTLKRMWLMQWVMEPTFHHPRTYMPVTHLTVDQAADVAAWILSQPAQELGANWKDLEVPEPSSKTLEQLANVYLERIISRSELNALHTGELDPERIKFLPQDEKILAENYIKDKDPDKRTNHLKWYVGRKAIGRLGCFGCHEIPGFDQSKPIGTPLNDWGKKDAERLAFEDIATFMKTHHSWKGHENPDGTPFDTFFAEALLHKTREGYLYQKLNEPRSYDFNRLRAWDDRSRMPKFSFARTRLAKGEKSVNDPKFKKRQREAESEARQAVMTFVLGLVAEPIPSKFVSAPGPDRLAEVRGLQVLERYNCIGCHQVQPGTFVFKKTDPVLNKFEELAKEKGDFTGELIDPHDNVWVGVKQTSPDWLVALGAHNPKTNLLALADAVRFGRERGGQPIEVNVPAATKIPYGAAGAPLTRDILFEGQPYGGTFADLLSEYLRRRLDMNPGAPELKVYSEPFGAPLASPPLLHHEGAKIQPSWLFLFLRNPYEMRPRTVLRMPRFNINEDDARALVNYFAAVERLTNPGIEVTYPYAKIPQHQADFWLEKTAEYVARLKSSVDDATKKTAYQDRLEKMSEVWGRIAQDEAFQQLKAAEAAVKVAEEQQKKAEGEDAKEFAAGELKKAKEVLTQAEQRLGRLKGYLDADRTFQNALADLTAAQQAEKDAKDKQQQEKAKAERVKAEEALRTAEQALQPKRDEVTVKDFGHLIKRWANEEAYAADAFRLILTGPGCRACHQIATYPAGDPNPWGQGPSLNLSHKRFRPDWMERWLKNPQRFTPYFNQVMPSNFSGKENQYQAIFAASDPAGPEGSVEQLRAVRDLVLYLPEISDMPVNRYFRPPVK